MINIKSKKLREELGLTQKQLADYLNVTRSTYSYYETGKIQWSACLHVSIAVFNGNFRRTRIRSVWT